jgi:hypothetical protein
VDDRRADRQQEDEKVVDVAPLAGAPAVVVQARPDTA